MNVAERLLADIREQGIQLEPRGDRLRYRPRSKATPELIERIAARKQDLLAILRREEATRAATINETIAAPTDGRSFVDQCDFYDRCAQWWRLVSHQDLKRLTTSPRGSPNRCPHCDRIWPPAQWTTGPLPGRHCPSCGGRNHQDRCAWCGGINHHSATCEELNDSWQVGLPWGRHKGRKLCDVPTSYLEWLSGLKEIDVRMREAIRRELDDRAKCRMDGSGRSWTAGAELPGFQAAE